jgi:broad specificity phosphatase PhoE
MSGMGTLYLVRHGQASLTAEDYDQLSPLGQQQSLALGQYWAARGLRVDAVITGTLRRHAQTWAGIAAGAQWPTDALPWPGLNEYDSAAVIQTVHPQPLTRPDTPERYRQHFRLLRDGLALWMAGTASPAGMPSYSDFVQGVTSALHHVRRQHLGQRVLVVSSGGPIATAVGHVLGLSPEATIGLNMRLRNSAVTELTFSARRYELLTFNTLPHLDAPERADWVTYA